LLIVVNDVSLRFYGELSNLESVHKGTTIFVNTKYILTFFSYYGPIFSDCDTKNAVFQAKNRQKRHF